MRWNFDDAGDLIFPDIRKFDQKAANDNFIKHPRKYHIDICLCVKLP